MRGGGLLQLLQISDSAFPTGSFAHSMGLEAFSDAGELRDAEDLRYFVGFHLAAMATSDCVAHRASYVADLDEVLRVDRLLTATKLTRELRVASAATGKRFLLSVAALGFDGEALRALTDAVREGVTPGNLAIGYAVTGAALGLALEATLHAYLYASVASLVSAGQKLIPLGGSAAQRVLYEMGEGIFRAARTSEDMEVDDMHAFSPTIDVRSMMHERQRTRLYIS